MLQLLKLYLTYYHTIMATPATLGLILATFATKKLFLTTPANHGLLITTPATLGLLLATFAIQEFFLTTPAHMRFSQLLLLS